MDTGTNKRVFREVIMSSRSRGHTLIELVTVCALMAILAGITVPAVIVSQARASTGAACEHLAVALRAAQARARAGGDAVRVSVDADGHGFRVETVGAHGVRFVDSGDFGSATCNSNFPGNAVEFAGLGWPRAIGAGVRAGTFKLTALNSTHAVVLQMGGVIRCQ
jgi:type II secretory pathway pseudopilin PulG